MFSSAMDLGCLDLGCLEKQKSNEGVLDSQNRERKEAGNSNPVMATAKVGKNKALKENIHSPVSSLNKCTTIIKKPPHRKASPLNWFPRKNVEPYLKRKIKLLQEVGGLNLTLDETLGDSNPHYSRVKREQIAARDAARKVMETRKAAMVEASWCRILRAARIQSKEAEALLLEAEKNVAEAFEAATAMGVIMYDIPNLSQKPCEIETCSTNGGGSTTHAVAASFETAFDVDKEVAAAVKIAFTRLANCSSVKDEFKDLLWKISQNPDTDESNQELSDFSSECDESDTGSKLEPNLQTDHLVNMMLERLKCLQEDELASLATIVATCGLNAALAEIEKDKQHGLGSALNFARRMSSLGAGTLRKFNIQHLMDSRSGPAKPEIPSLDKFLVKHMSKLEREVQEAKNAKSREPREGTAHNPNKCETIPDLGSILVKKHSSKLEQEIEEAKKNSGKMFEKCSKNSDSCTTSSDAIPDLGSILIKHSSKLEKEIEETKKNNGERDESNGKKSEKMHITRAKQDVSEFPSLDEVLVKRVSRLEREVQEARDKRKNVPVVANLKKENDPFIPVTQSEVTDEGQVGKENIDTNKEVVEGNVKTEQDDIRVDEGQVGNEEKAGTKETESSLDKILIKPPVHRLVREKMQALSLEGDHTILPKHQKKGGNVKDCESLDKVLVKHVSRLEKEKMSFHSNEEMVKVKRSDRNIQFGKHGEGSLDQILVIHKSRLEREKMAASSQQQPREEENRSSVARREARAREMQETWGGLSLGSSKGKNEIKQKSRLEREKMAGSQQPGEENIKPSVSRKEAREREMQEAWGGLGLGNSIQPHLSRLERDKAAWIKAEEEERRQVVNES